MVMKPFFSTEEMMVAVFLLMKFAPYEDYTRSNIRCFLCMPEQSCAADEVLDELLCLGMIYYRGRYLDIEENREYLLKTWEEKKKNGFSREELQYFASGMLHNWISWKAAHAIPDSAAGYKDGINIIYILTDTLEGVSQMKGLYLTASWLAGVERYGFLPDPDDYAEAVEDVYDINMYLQDDSLADYGCIFGIEPHTVKLDASSDLARLYPNIQGPVLLLKLRLKGGFQFVLYEVNTRAMTLVWEVPRMTWKLAERESILTLEVICSESPEEDNYELVIPAEIMGFAVQKLPEFFQRARTRCRRLVIPGSIKEVQNEALGSCYLREIILQDSTSNPITSDSFGVYGGMITGIYTKTN